MLAHSLVAFIQIHTLSPLINSDNQGDMIHPTERVYSQIFVDTQVRKLRRASNNLQKLCSLSMRT